MNLITFVAFFLCFSLFLPKLVDLFGTQRKDGFYRIFFSRINKFIWGMSLADRPIICKKMQEIEQNTISGD